MALAAALASALTEARATMAASVVHEENFFDDACLRDTARRRPSVLTTERPLVFRPVERRERVPPLPNRTAYLYIYQV